VKSGERLLIVLRSLNRLGPSTVLGLSRATGMPRPTIHRAVQALCRQGYVAQIPSQSRFRLTSNVRHLSSGFRSDDGIAEIGAPVILRIQRKLLWPTTLAAFDRDAMVVHETTRHRSPFVFDWGAVGVRLPMLTTAMGLAFLAFSSAEKRRLILNLLRNSSARDDDPAHNAKAVDRLIRSTARRGFGLRQGGIVPQTTSIAVPLIAKNDTLGTIAITFASSALPLEQAVTKFVPVLRDAALEISKSAADQIRD
jgi:IclR family transcriptional regulator, mhp operon transcriptional activator